MQVGVTPLLLSKARRQDQENSLSGNQAEFKDQIISQEFHTSTSGHTASVSVYEYCLSNKSLKSCSLNNCC